MEHTAAPPEGLSGRRRMSRISTLVLLGERMWSMLDLVVHRTSGAFGDVKEHLCGLCGLWLQAWSVGLACRESAAPAFGPLAGAGG